MSNNDGPVGGRLGVFRAEAGPAEEEPEQPRVPLANHPKDGRLPDEDLEQGDRMRLRKKNHPKFCLTTILSKSM
jgi:hypothetical protein